MPVWQRWIEHPERIWARNLVFQIHFWVGVLTGAYMLMMSVTGSLIVFRNELYRRFSVEPVVGLHTNLFAGTPGRLVNGVGAISLTVLCVTGAVIWWPGTKYWRRSLTVDWRAHAPRIIWDLHSAIGVWSFLFVLLWGVSGLYFSFPKWFDALLLFDPGDRVTDQALSWLSQLHFGRFGWLIEGVWTLLGLVPGVLALTGIFICCRRVIFKKPSNPKEASG
jgi:uncharacterized iron-regulated membrane protein